MSGDEKLALLRRQPARYSVGDHDPAGTYRPTICQDGLDGIARGRDVVRPLTRLLAARAPADAERFIAAAPRQMK